MTAEIARTLDIKDEPLTSSELLQLEEDFGFKYQEIVGLLLYAFVSTRVDKGFTITTLSKFNVSPK